MTTATLPIATLPMCPECKKAPAKHALEMRDAEGNLTRVRYACSDVLNCDHVWNDPPVPKAATPAKAPPGVGVQVSQHWRAYTAGLKRPPEDTVHLVAPSRGPSSQLELRTCARPGCDKRFQPYRSDSRFCCPACRKATGNAKRPPLFMERPCDRCGEGFKPSASNQAFCTTECSVAARNARRRAKRAAR